MSWDEALFGWFYRKAREVTRRGPSSAALARSAHFEELRARLSLIANALAGARLELRASEGVGGYVGDTILLPERIDLAPDREGNERVYLLRVVLHVAARALGLTVVPGTSDHEALALTARAMPAIIDEARALAPGVDELVREVFAWELASRHDATRLSPREAAVETLVREALARASGVEAQAVTVTKEHRGTNRAKPVISWGTLMPRGEVHAAAGAKSPMPASALPGGTERQGKARDHVRRVEMRDDRHDENPLTHSFEKVHTAEEYKGGRKAADGSDEMAEHGDALDELDMREVVRSPETTRSLLRADVMMEGAAGDLLDDGSHSGGEVFLYDEWDQRARTWRDEWCSLRSAVVPEKVPAARAKEIVTSVLHKHRGEVRALRAEFERLEHGRAWRTRQPDGPDVDTDAMVDRFACLRAGHSPPDRMYVSRRRCERGVATVILLDASLSTDAWVAGRRVLDVARDAVIMLGEALDGLHDELGVATFWSHTRRDCRFGVIKGMTEPWARAWPRIVSVEPAGYTRIGPALRHATRLLSKTRARKRLLLIVSDGRPTDYDRYEGRYGVGDVSMAVRETSDSGVQPFALTVDAGSRHTFAEMFGQGRYAVLTRPDHLVDAMAEVYERVLR